jgi:hypothetical protein
MKAVYNDQKVIYREIRKFSSSDLSVIQLEAGQVPPRDGLHSNSTSLMPKASKMCSYGGELALTNNLPNVNTQKDFTGG